MKTDITIPDGKPQALHQFGEPTGFTDRNNTPIKVGDFMEITHGCNCAYCIQTFPCQILWNDEGKCYGFYHNPSKSWLSGMGMAGVCQIRTPPNKCKIC